MEAIAPCSGLDLSDAQKRFEGLDDYVELLE